MYRAGTVLSLIAALLLITSDAKKGGLLIPSAGAAELWNGNGDLNTTAGKCAPDAEAFCKDLLPGGDGRVAACLSQRDSAIREGNASGRKIGKKCVEELRAFKRDRSSNINKNRPLARACKNEAKKYCKEVSDVESPGSVILCLKENSEKLAAGCKNEVFKTQQEALEDYATDYKLFTACKDDAGTLCKDVEPGSDRIMQCLSLKRYGVSSQCLPQLARHERETGSDLRLSVRLHDKCRSDYDRYCKDVQPGNMQAQECLEDHISDTAFSPECKAELEATIARRVADFSLDTALRKACEQDLQTTCGHSLAEIDGNEDVRTASMNCLQSFKDELSSPKCKAEVHRRMTRAGRNVLLDDQLATACKNDRASLCSNIEPGSARVIRCLQDNREQLSSRCAAALFDHEVRVSEDIDFNFSLKKTCAYEISELCQNVPHGQARVIRCLEEKTSDSQMSSECKKEVQRMQNYRARDYRLNYRLNHACSRDIKNLCRNVCNPMPGQSCSGQVLQCLQDKKNELSTPACQEEVFYFILMEVKDYRNDVILAEACRSDVSTYCTGVEPGEGRVHLCLRFNLDKLSERCRDEEMKLASLEYSDVRLNTKLNKLCSEERSVYCKEVKPGRGQVIRCLVSNMAQTGFGSECKKELQEREAVMRTDIRFDATASANCAADIDNFCKAEKSMLRGRATVMKCLIDHHDDLGAQCQSDMSRAVRLALWDYKPGTSLTQMCDADVSTYCPQNAASKSGAALTIGVVGRCLSKTLVQAKPMEGKCRELVLVAAPKDVRSYLSNPESSSVLLQKIAEIQKAAGLELVNPNARRGSAITVTGWVALACIISLFVVAVGGGFMLFRYLSGHSNPYTVHIRGLA